MRSRCSSVRSTPDDDQLMAIAAVHALGAVFDDAAADVLSDLLSDPQLFLREHAAWALGSRTPRLERSAGWSPGSPRAASPP